MNLHLISRRTIENKFIFKLVKNCLFDKRKTEIKSLFLIIYFQTWYYAAVQLFFSTQIGFGNITTASGKIYSKSNAFW